MITTMAAGGSMTATTTIQENAMIVDAVRMWAASAQPGTHR